MTRHLTQAGYDVSTLRVETAESLKAALGSQEWDIALCDFSMPHLNALDALRILNEMRLDIPFIIISGTVGETVAVEAMRAGAHDYLMKGNLLRLVPTIKREMHEAENRRARKRAEESLKQTEVELSVLFAALTDVVMVLDRDGRLRRDRAGDAALLLGASDIESSAAAEAPASAPLNRVSTSVRNRCHSLPCSGNSASRRSARASRFDGRPLIAAAGSFGIRLDSCACVRRTTLSGVST
jgi:FixJ family two-component response regulator